MTLASGTRLGPYEIHSALGAGGMGEVYRARDTRLKRDVALKILPESFATDPDRLARFQREAEVLASLNHPNIAAIHGIEDSDGTLALIMELVEGETLADRIARGPLPLDEALPIARQIAEALEAAHEQGIIHRDLKPANIKVRPDGTVKVLDFGLAKALHGPVPDANVSHSPTLSIAATGAGIVLGTAAYMSPEQARGKTVDKRTDLWAFGCVLFEMLTGAPAFAGEDVTEIIAAVVMKDPPFETVPSQVPPAIQTLLRRCLRKDRRERLPDAGAARVEIQDALNPQQVAAPATGPVAIRPTGTRLFVPWSIAAIATIAAIVAGVPYLVRSSSDAAAIRFFVEPPAGLSIDTVGSGGATAQAPVVISPDGRQIAFVTRSKAGTRQLWVRPLDGLDARLLNGTDGAMSPFWSYDSRFIGFFADGKLKKIDITGGAPLTLSDAPDPRGGAWNADDVIVFSPGAGPLKKVSAAGGDPSDATTLAPGEVRHGRPFFLPDGRHLFHNVQGGAQGIYLSALDSTERKPIALNTDTVPIVFSQGHLLFVRQGTLVAQPFDDASLELTGEAVPVAEQLQITGGPNPYIALFSASANGVLVYRTGSVNANASTLQWVDRAGNRLRTLGEEGDYGDLALSPDATRVVVSIMDRARNTRDLWIYDILRDVRTRFTFDAGNDRFPSWTPDGAHIVFSSNRTGNEDLFRKSSNGAGAEEAVLTAEGAQRPFGWSSDGRYLVYESGSPQPDIWVLPTFGDRKPFPLFETPFAEAQPRLSPDEKWLAYQSNESGRAEVYVTGFPKAAGKWQVSTSGGSWPAWNATGTELFYLNVGTSEFLAADVSSEAGGFRVRNVQPLFQMSARLGGGSTYAVTPDGKRFLINTVPELGNVAPLTVVVNWPAALRR